MAPAPNVSVVTVVFNGNQHLRDCLESVASQTGALVEHIVIDGGSTDGTLRLLEQWTDRLAFWVSEPDSGIADAMNKGIRQAHGDWILFLHADDYLPDSTSLGNAIGRIKIETDVAAFPVLFGTPPQLKQVRPRSVGPVLNIKLGMCHQGILIRRDLFLRVGEHDTSHRVAMDYDFLLRAHRRGAMITTFAEPTLSVMRDTGISSRVDWPSLSKRFGEERAIHFRHAPGNAHRIAYGIYWALYLPYRRLRAAMGR